MSDYKRTATSSVLLYTITAATLQLSLECLQIKPFIIKDFTAKFSTIIVNSAHAHKKLRLGELGEIELTSARNQKKLRIIIMRHVTMTKWVLQSKTVHIIGSFYSYQNHMDNYCNSYENTPPSTPHHFPSSKYNRKQEVYQSGISGPSCFHLVPMK